MTETYDFRGLAAKASDLLRGDPSAWPDGPVYRAVIERQGGPALDVGCGTGWRLLDLLAARLDVDGVDSSPEMLAICRAKAKALGVDLRGRLHEQPIQRLSLPRRYATIFAPSPSFQRLTDPDDARAALRRFREHLAPTGVLVIAFDARPWPDQTPPPALAWSAWAVDAEELRESDGATVRRWTRRRFDHDRRRVDEEYRHQVLIGGEVVQSEFHGRAACWHTRDEAVALFEAAGFREIVVTAGDGFEPAAPGEARFKVSGTRP
ncbi:MAG TPA: class I SAM-dependent methyltransferase [Caulobacteraceae bacterium]|nr:class I SAM-dependent methyltransferase [Caulobacteraceae bacterium]